MNFEFAYTLNYGTDLDYHMITMICPALSLLADKVTDNDRSAWGLYLYENEVGVGFHREDDRDYFAQAYTGIVTAKPSKGAPNIAPTPSRRKGHRTRR